MEESKGNERQVRMAFLIPLFKDVSHFKRLLRALPEEADFYVHVDAKVSDEPFRQAAAGYRVHFVEKRYNIVWGSCTQVWSQMEQIRAALDSGIDYDYFFIISGQDYPLWSNDRIRRFVSENRNRSYLKAVCMVGQGWHARGYRRYYFFQNKPWLPGSWKSKFRGVLRRILTPVLRKPLAFNADGHYYRLYKGSDWFGITPRLARLVVNRWDSSPSLRRYFKTGFAPSETCIQTIAFNSPLAGQCLHVEGGFQSLTALTPLTFIDYNPLIKELDETDFPRLKASGKMFCRKVVSGKSDQLVALIDQERGE